jgi:3-hydroxybutyryl-CoA dehydrogenase
MEIKKVCILGAGNLGSRVGLQAVLSGYEVSIYDSNQAALEKSPKLMAKIIRHLEKTNQLELGKEEEIIGKIVYTADPNKGVDDADLINESVTEDVAVKEGIWELMGKIAPEKTIFTTNSSFLLPSQFAEISGRPANFCALHFHDVFYSKVVDIMPHPGTDLKWIPVLEKFSRSLFQVPVVIQKENPGYLFNTMLMAFLGTAGKLLTREIATIEAIDKSWMVNFHVPMGPFGLLDSIGLDTAWHVTRQMPDKHSQAFAGLLKEYIDQGKLGEKTGEGFYTYPKPAFRDKDFLS